VCCSSLKEEGQSAAAPRPTSSKVAYEKEETCGVHTSSSNVWSCLMSPVAELSLA
jgi:hypothetical protein